MNVKIIKHNDKSCVFIFNFANLFFNLYTLNKLNISSLQKFFTEKRNIVLVSHSNPDGDAVGSSLALYNYFLNYNHEVNVILPNNFADYLAWMKGSEKILIYNSKQKACDLLIDNADVIFCLDFNALNRVEKLEESLRKAKAKKVLIDHHLQPELDSFEYIFSEITVTFSVEKTGFKKSISVDVKAIDVFLLNESFNKKMPKQTKPICAITSVKITPGVTG